MEAEEQAVRDLIAKLSEAHGAQAAILAEAQDARGELERVQSATAQAVSDLEAAETASALSGTLPEAAFPQEAVVEKLRRHARVLTARLATIQERSTRGEAAIKELTGRLQAAWFSFGQAEAARVRAAYREAAQVVARLYAEQVVYGTIFGGARGGARILAPGNLVIENVEGTTTDRLLAEGNMLGNEHFWRPLAGGLYGRLRTLQGEIAKAKGLPE